MEGIEDKIEYRFRDPQYLEKALTHSSFGYENDTAHNERLEFLGDSILGYVVSRELFKHFPEENEGTLSKLKSVLVSSKMLAAKARRLGLGAALRLGRGEMKAKGYRKPSILADGMEALIGAIALDGGLVAADSFIQWLYGDEIKNATLDLKNNLDFKTLLQEKLQELGLGLPNYLPRGEKGPPHNRTFLVCAEIGDYQGPVGTGTSKKKAQQESARLVLEDAIFWKSLRGETDEQPGSGKKGVG